MSRPFVRPVCLRHFAASAALLLVAGCHDSSSTAEAALPPDVPLQNTELERADDPPGVRVAVVAVTGSSGIDGTFQVGDHVTVDFTIRKNDGTTWRLDDFGLGRILISGPSFNYQRVIPEQSDLLTRSVRQADGSFRYTFADPLPSVYAAPINDSTAFGSGDGELAGTALLAGTYTVGLYVRWNYTVDGTAARDADDATADFQFGGATTVTHRAVVGQANCNRCHESLRVHGGMRREVGLCVLCHTSGAEDRSHAGVSIDFRVMIHKIHDAAHLPSVLGVGTRADGSRDYTVTPRPYVITASRAEDFSAVTFPVWPAGEIPMPRDSGYSTLAQDSYRVAEDTIRSGVTTCAACHGDPDGAGPIAAPAQGQVAYAQPSRRACGSCHDDVDWTRPYTSNTSTMPPQGNDSSCLLCHGVVGTAISPEVAHLHPMLDPVFNTGLQVAVTAVAEAGNNNSDGTIDPGEKVAVTVSVTDDSGTAVSPPPAALSVVVSGPTSNNNLVLNTSIPVGAFSGTQPYTVLLPQGQVLERVGAATASLGDEFTTALAPHWDMTGAATTLFVRTATGGGASTAAGAITAPTNWVDVASPTGFARNDFVAVDDGSANVEYAQITSVLGTRLWFGSALQRNHAAGVTVAEVTLTQKTRNTHYSLTAATGVLTELAEFGAGNDVVVSYTSDFRMPARFPLTINDSPGLDDSIAKWAGKTIVDGTYAVTAWTSRTLTLNLFGEANSYRSTSKGARREFLVGNAVTLQPYALIDGGSSCESCHQEVLAHGGGRRGFTTCIACHGNAGGEDRPQYVAPGAPATDGVTINFRSMLHKIHMGQDLANASTYTVVGFGSAAYPNNYSSLTFGEVAFPAMPGGVLQCTKCHGTANQAWKEPQVRTHPTQQVHPAQVWRTACGSCHDSDAATAHIGVQTAADGTESCSVCHGVGRDWHVQLMHKAR